MKLIAILKNNFKILSNIKRKYQNRNLKTVFKIISWNNNQIKVKRN